MSPVGTKLVEALRTAARPVMQKTAVVAEETQVSFAELLDQIEHWTRFLLGLGGSVDESRRLVVFGALPSGAACTVLHFAAPGAGAVFAPSPPDQTSWELGNSFQVCRPDVVVSSNAKLLAEAKQILGPNVILVFCAEGDPSGAAPPTDVTTWADILAGRLPSRPAQLGPPSSLPPGTDLLLFTSGTTSLPKGVALTTANILAGLRCSAAFLKDLTTGSVLCPMPQYHAFASTVVFESLLSGATIRLMNRILPGECLPVLKDPGCSAVFAGPTFFQLMGQTGVLDALAGNQIHGLCIGTAATAPRLFATLQRAFPGAQIIVRYGLTETQGPLAFSRVRPGEPAPEEGVVGIPTEGVEIVARDLDEDGAFELRVKSDTLAAGYVTSPEAWSSITDNENIFSTGDLARWLPDGRLRLMGRLSTFIKHRGFRINPTEIEAALRRDPRVVDVAVVGTPDPVHGEEIVACLELSEEVSSHELRQLCASALSSYKIPRRFVKMDKLPRTPIGKLARQQLKDEVGKARAIVS
jgi:long-chain acyl-CoA synthetase